MSRPSGQYAANKKLINIAIVTNLFFGKDALLEGR